MNKNYIKHIPNSLTGLRFILTPLCIFLLISKSWNYLALLFFVIASITDFFDGYFARKYSTISKIGAFLDPLADKFLVVGMFCSFFYLGRVVDVYILSMVVFRDVFVTILRILMQSKGYTMVTSRLSKSKTTVQIVVIILLFLSESSIGISQEILYFLALSMAILTLYTGFHYLFYNFKQLKILLTHE